MSIPWWLHVLVGLGFLLPYHTFDARVLLDHRVGFSVLVFHFFFPAVLGSVSPTSPLTAPPRGSAPPSTSSLSFRLTLFEGEPFSRPIGSRVRENLLSFGFAFLSPMGLTRGIGGILRVCSFQGFPFERKKSLPRGSDFGGISVARVLRVLRSTAASKARTRRIQWMIGPPRGQIDRTSTCLRTKWRRSRRTPRACQARGDEMDRCLVERFPSRCRRHHRQ